MYFFPFAVLIDVSLMQPQMQKMLLEVSKGDVPQSLSVVYLIFFSDLLMTKSLYDFY